MPRRSKFKQASVRSEADRVLRIANRIYVNSARFPRHFFRLSDIFLARSIVPLLFLSLGCLLTAENDVPFKLWLLSTANVFCIIQTDRSLRMAYKH